MEEFTLNRTRARRDLTRWDQHAGGGGGGAYSDSYTRGGAIPNKVGPAHCRATPALNLQEEEERSLLQAVTGEASTTRCRVAPAQTRDTPGPHLCRNIGSIQQRTTQSLQTPVECFRSPAGGRQFGPPARGRR